MADADLEVDLPGFYLLEDFFFSDKDRAGSRCFFSYFGIWWADDADAHVGSDCVGEGYLVTDDGAILSCFEFQMDFIFDGLEFSACFECADMSVARSWVRIDSPVKKKKKKRYGPETKL